MEIEDREITDEELVSLMMVSPESARTEALMRRYRRGDASALSELTRGFELPRGTLFPAIVLNGGAVYGYVGTTVEEERVALLRFRDGTEKIFWVPASWDVGTTVNQGEGEVLQVAEIRPGERLPESEWRAIVERVWGHW